MIIKVNFLKIASLLLLLAMFLPLSPSIAKTSDSLTLKPTQDTMIISTYPDSNYGFDTDIEIAKEETKLEYVLIHFDLSYYGGLMESVTGAVLSLFPIVVSDTRVVTFHKIQTTWDETTLTWNNFNYQYEIDYNSTWTFIAGSLSVEIVLSQLVRAWVSGEIQNYGVLLKMEDGDASTDGNIWFYSKESQFSFPYIDIYYVAISEGPPIQILFSALLAISIIGTSKNYFGRKLS